MLNGLITVRLILRLTTHFERYRTEIYEVVSSSPCFTVVSQLLLERAKNVALSGVIGSINPAALSSHGTLAMGEAKVYLTGGAPVEFFQRSTGDRKQMRWSGTCRCRELCGGGNEAAETGGVGFAYGLKVVELRVRPD